MSLWDSFLYLNEDELLDIRLHELAPVVDGFIIVEATHTHQGDLKPLRFDKERYKEYNIHYVISSAPYTDSPTLEQMRENEIAQRNLCLDGLTDKTDSVIISDLDEIPSREVIAEIKALPRAMLPVKVRHQSCYYYLNQIGQPIFNNPYGAVVVSVEDAYRVTPQMLRLCLYDPRMPSLAGGWHVRFTGGENVVAQKLAGVFPDEEYERAKEELIFSRFDGPLPHLIREQPERFKDLIKPKE